LTYLRAIENAGGEPILIARPSKDELIDLVKNSDGLLLSGGDDISPEYYGETLRPYSGKLDPTKRDYCEIILLEHAYAKKIPILGICRGLQMINVFLGGTLHQDIAHEAIDLEKHNYFTHEDGTRIPRDHRAHNINIALDSLLYRITKKDTLFVNSLHHQGIKIIGKKLRPVAHTADGLIEGIEGIDYPLLLGVQWHPEELKDDESQVIFQYFVDAARNQ